MYNTNISEDFKKKHEFIVQEAKEFAEQAYEMLRVGTIPEFMVQMQQQQMQVNIYKTK